MSSSKYSAILLLALLPLSAWSTPAVTVVVSAPASSSAAVSGKSIVKSMLFSPCVNAKTDFGGGSVGSPAVTVKPNVTVTNFFDQLNIKITGTNDDADKNGIYDYDLYFFLVNTSGTGNVSPTTIADAQFYVFRRYLAATQSGTPQKLYGVDVTLISSVGSGVPDMLLRGVDFSSSAINEIIFGGDIAFDGFNLPQGTWVAVAILAQGALDLNAPGSWAAWDAFPFMLGSPWVTNPAKTCQ